MWELFHKQGDKIESTASLLAETRADVKGLTTHLERFMDDYKTGQHNVMSALDNMKKPQPNQLWQIVGVCLVILGMFGGVMIKTVADSKEVAQLKFEHSNEVADLKFQDSVSSVHQQQTELKALFDRQEGFTKDIQLMAFEGGKQTQQVEGLTLFARRMDVELQTRLLAAETRLSSVEALVTAARDNILTIGGLLQEHGSRANGHPESYIEVKVKETPHEQ